jgi:O-acetyl-ADP-ribose deacetylase (regulator of RNase III)
MFKQTVASQNETLKKENMLPRGSALITTSGKLAKSGIYAIINAATGSMTKSGSLFEPTKDSLTQSIINSFKLLDANSYNKIAVPYICGGIFKTRMGVTNEQLAKLIIDVCFKANPDASKFVLVMIDYHIYKIFETILIKDYPKVDTKAILKQGSVTDFNIHKCNTIMNASNMEVLFGGGLAGAIGSATGDKVTINNQALAEIKTFWK